MLRKGNKISSNKNAESIPEPNDVKKTSEQKKIKQHAFSHLLHINQPHSQNLNIANVCTRNKPHKNPFNQKIIKRFRGRKRKDMKSNDRSNTPQDNLKTTTTKPSRPQQALLSEPRRTIAQTLVRA